MPNELNKIIVDALEDLKGKDIVCLDVSELSDIMDTLIIASGTSNRHVKSLASNVVQEAKDRGIAAIGVEGLDSGEWVLADFGDTVVHVMMPATRGFYDLEKLWSMEPGSRSSDSE
ncbi:MAG: ribosome silencing factor [Gammaproteobacteria bacterium]|uniref:ribosome silencing factor n=1 Tax=Pseudomaricurvus alcaniphilus TaxID=1166482 RepID=UPI00140C837F|nr:ribosome silencing factor [Pseudomaricurvus alcaniphilus]MBR9910496.1 ribosome silencing factor [Gammaproteobacteria bacterium]NHN39705.1 ribosome silencing factor [Pseudomaricurvus alcaniphilus]